LCADDSARTLEQCPAVHPQLRSEPRAIAPACARHRSCGRSTMVPMRHPLADPLCLRLRLAIGMVSPR
jgi:hypothetical protein